MAQFYNISLQEIKDFLKAEKGWKLNDSQHREIVFDYNLKKAPFLLVRVYSGILKETGVSRGRGEDAIRVCCVNLATDRGFIKAKRVHRVTNWQENLKNRVCSVIKEAEKRLNNEKVLTRP